MNISAEELEYNKNSPWKPIETFDGRMFSVMTNGTPDTTEIVKYNGTIPGWATYWRPMIGLPNE